ncbi:glycosyltransferase [Microbacterium hominis]|uniref:Glycosyltransferase n=1 Tax=Microbacterium hominis TaxID=162426 RepID=A0A7D4TLC0_9MICO|nr:nucleotide disphospho-sugar-binding domain-containing protein [Microbacterium hominis]QKJ18142.1 glycosyltransferase [Microbacterium hominis]
MGAMARFLLSAMPFTGHVTPVLAVAAALVDRGHEVRVYTGSAFASRVAAVGATLVPWREAPDFDENDLESSFPRVRDRKGLRQVMINLTDVFVRTAPGQVADLAAEWEREPWDVIAGDDVALGGSLLSELQGRPWATIGILPLNMTVTDGPPSGIGLTPGHTPLLRGRDAALRALAPLMARPLAGPLREARAAVGLPPQRRYFSEEVYSSTLVLASGTPSLDFDRSGRPPHVHFVGRLATPAPTRDDDLPSWWGDLDGRPVVHVTQGTQNIDPADLIRPTLEALASRDVLVVVATGVRGRDTLPFPVPPNARVAGFLPYDRLLPRVDAMVTNGGWGGTLTALDHGVPLVIAGGDLDKPEIAARVAWTGAAVNLRTGTPTATQVGAAVDRALADDSMREAAARISAELRALGGAQRAAELLESLA